MFHVLILSEIGCVSAYVGLLAKQGRYAEFLTAGIGARFADWVMGYWVGGTGVASGLGCCVQVLTNHEIIGVEGLGREKVKGGQQVKVTIIQGIYYMRSRPLLILYSAT